MIIDVGCGDGRFPYQRARDDPEALYIGIDPDADTLAEYAYRASRKPSRGGVANVLYVVAALQDLPAELAGIADIVCVNFPWGGLLRGLLIPDPAVLGAVAGLAKPGGRFEVVLTFDAAHDAGVFGDLESPSLDEQYIREVLAAPYAAAGLKVEDVREITREEALALPSTWGRRLLHGRVRRVYHIEGLVAV